MFHSEDAKAAPKAFNAHAHKGRTFDIEHPLTLDWAKIADYLGSIPDARQVAAEFNVELIRSLGSCSTVIECKLAKKE